MNINVQQQQNILITGGRAPVALELARQFALAGHRVFVAESVKHHLCRVSTAVVRSYVVPKPNDDHGAYIAALRTIVFQEKIDFLLPTCEEIFHIAKGKAELSLHCEVFAESLDVLHKLHNKATFITLAHELGFHVPFTRTVTKPAQWDEVKLDLRFHDKVVLKPIYSRFSSQVRFVERSAFAAPDFQLPLPVHIPWVVQQYVAGRPLCTYSVVHQGQVTAHVTYSPSYTAGKGAGVYFASLQHEELEQWVQRFVRALRFSGQIAFDFIETTEGNLLPIECNPRATSGVHLLAKADGRLANVMVKGSDSSSDRSLRPLTAAPGQKTKLGLAMLAYGTSHMFHPTRRQAWWAAFRSSKDVIFRRHDWRPYLEQLRILQEARRTAKADRLTLMQATTADIEWNGGSL